MSSPQPWLRPTRVTEAVSDWTGVGREELRAPHGELRGMKAKRLLADCLVRGCDLSRRSALLWLGYSSTGGSSAYKIFDKADPLEVDAVLARARKESTRV